MTHPARVPHDGAPENLESTISLLGRIRQGDERARDLLLARYLPLLRRWAHGRLPSHARRLVDTDDLVQVSLIRSLNHMETFEPSREGAFLVYLRRAVLNAMRDEIRRSHPERHVGPTSEDVPDQVQSGLEAAIGRETVEHYEAALAELEEEPRQAVILRVEFGYTYEQIAEAIGKPTANAARMAVSRAMLRLAEAMREHRP
jgi:RNA polymerase sigma factor (sigma-70 family)